MKLFKNNNLIVRFLSLVLTVALTVVVSATDTGYAEYPHAYDSASPDEEYYIWTRVDSDRKPLYEYLSDGDNPAYTTNSGARKTFRVMLVHHYKRKFEDWAALRTLSTLWGGMDLAGDDSYDWKTIAGPGGAFYYDTYMQTFADWTRFDYGNNNEWGGAITKASNKQLLVDQEQFVTRGAQRSFICDYDRQWVKGGGDSEGDLADKFEGIYRYHFYIPDEADRSPLLTLGYVQPGFSTGSPGDFFLWDKDGKVWDEDGKRSGQKYEKSEVGNMGHDTWAIYKMGTDSKRLDNFKILSHDREDDDYALGILKSGNMYCNNWSENREDNENGWMIYVGEPVPSNLLSNMKSSSNDSLSAGNSRTISSPVFLKRHEDFIIEEGAILFVDSTILLRGRIINNGLIIIGQNGGIISWGGDAGTLDCTGGDIIVKNNGAVQSSAYSGGSMFVNTFKAKNQTLMLYSPVYFKNLTMDNCVLDIRNSNAKLGKASNLDNYKNFYNAYRNNGKFVLDFHPSATKLTGNGDSFKQNNVVNHSDKI